MVPRVYTKNNLQFIIIDIIIYLNIERLGYR